MDKDALNMTPSYRTITWGGILFWYGVFGMAWDGAFGPYKSP